MNRVWNMPTACKQLFTQQGWKPLSIASALLFCSVLSQSSEAQVVNPFLSRVVGGVKIDTDGVVQNVTVQDSANWVAAAKKVVGGAPAELAKKADIRHISLKHLAAKVAEAHQNNTEISEELAFLGGLTRIEYLLLYPESNDIVIAGPAENWKVNDAGVVVGVKSGLPIVKLQDLVVAFSKLNASNPESISCSIEPTPEGNQQLEQLLSRVSLSAGQSPAALEPAMREAFGAQQVLFTGVEGNSSIGRVIFGADYQMKRIGMKLKESPVKGVPSYIDMLRHASAPKNQSRWWFSCNYDSVERSDDSLAWHLTGSGLKLQTEEEVTQSDGSRLGTGEKNAVAQKWADIFTSKIDELSVAEPVIGELRTVMDVCVVAAIIRSYGLEDVAHCDLSAFKTVAFENDGDLSAPRTVDPQCSFVRAGQSWIVTASGGVLIDPWATVQEAKIDNSITKVQAEGKPSSDNWFWN